MQYPIYTFAQTYGGGTYDSSTYQAGATTTSTSPVGTTGGTTSGTLTNTGFDIILAASLASLIIFASLLVRFWKRPVAQEISTAITSRRKT